MTALLPPIMVFSSSFLTSSDKMLTIIVQRSRLRPNLLARIPGRFHLHIFTRRSVLPYPCSMNCINLTCEEQATSAPGPDPERASQTSLARTSHRPCPRPVLALLQITDHYLKNLFSFAFWLANEAYICAMIDDVHFFPHLMSFGLICDVIYAFFL